MEIDELLLQSFRVLMYDEMEHYSGTIKALVLSLANEKNSHGYNNLGIAYFEIGDYDYALKSFDEAINLDPKNDVAFVNRGLLHDKSGRHKDADTDYTQALKLNPTNPTYWRCRAYLRKQSGTLEAALQDFYEAQNIEPEMERTNKEIKDLENRLANNSEN